MKEDIELGSVDDERFAGLDFAEVILDAGTDCVFCKVLVLRDEDLLEKRLLFIEIQLETEIEFLSLFAEIHDAVLVLDSGGRSSAMGLSFTGGGSELR